MKNKATWPNENTHWEMLNDNPALVAVLSSLRSYEVGTDGYVDTRGVSPRELEDYAISNGCYEYIIRVAKCVQGADIKRLADFLIDESSPKWIIRFARDISFALGRKLALAMMSRVEGLEAERNQLLEQGFSGLSSFEEHLKSSNSIPSFISKGLSNNERLLATRSLWLESEVEFLRDKAWDQEHQAFFEKKHPSL